MTAGQNISLLQRLAARFERSQHVFLAGLVLAFAVEIVVDWYSAFYEIKVLRSALRDKASHFVGVLRLGVEESVAAQDQRRLRMFGQRILGDREVMYVRFTDATGATLVEVGERLGLRYPRQIERDLRRILASPEDLRRSIAQSQHRDLFQIVADLEEGLLRRVAPAAAPPPPSGVEAAVVYQDRLYDEKTGKEDRRVVWALGVVEDRHGGKAGVVLVALGTRALHKATQKKVFKAAAITIFFLAVILVQQLSARRAKLRMLSLRDTLAAARRAIRAALPAEPPSIEGLKGAIAFEQAERLGGTVYDLTVPPGRPRCLDVFVGLPEGSGVDVALAAVFVRDEERRLRRERPDAPPHLLLGALGAAYEDAPINRRLALVLFRVDLDASEVTGVLCGASRPVVIDTTGHELPARIEPWSLPDRGTKDAASAQRGPLRLLEEPLQCFRIELPPGALLLFYDDGLAASARRPLPRDEMMRRVREHLGQAPDELVASLRDATARRTDTLSDDLIVLALVRGEAGAGRAPVGDGA